ncbi:CLUMA_CG021556, isoform A [Clunio marinus]|uniref:CLUMA_CG021556, isoform A n=1 Tax=Clunio marinus TaxID=568069 RepID=A0A1J1JAR9_9DIPT|nr:CLUMA_CG021556, isoform A [Clunio marinus]
MPRYRPEKDCDFYAERLVDYFTNEESHVVRKNHLVNPVPWFHDQDSEDNPSRSFICSWGIEDNFKEVTGWECKKFIKSRLRENARIPTAGRQGLWKITKACPCGFNSLKFHKWKLSDWLKESSSKCPSKK